MKNYVLMTATVTPPADSFGLTRVDPELRLNDYIGAFKYYLSDEVSDIDGIIFVDNSNNALIEIKDLAQNYRGSKQVEILSFFGLDYPVEYGRGYGEFKLIEYAFENSVLIHDMSDSDRFWKVTGRLKVITINKIIVKTSRYFDLCADFRFKRKWVDTRLIAFSLMGYKKYIYGKLHEMPYVAIESWIFEKIAPLLDADEAKDILTEFRCVAKFEGFAGFQSQNYMAPKQKLIYFVRSVYLTIKYTFKAD